jgi:hypothetical protein
MKARSSSLKRYFGTQCPWCAKPMTKAGPRFPTREHLVPQHKAHGHGPVVVICQPCNVSKGSLTLDEWLAVLHARGDVRKKAVQSWMERHPSVVGEARRLVRDLNGKDRDNGNDTQELERA